MNSKKFMTPAMIRRKLAKRPLTGNTYLAIVQPIRQATERESSVLPGFTGVDGWEFTSGITETEFRKQLELQEKDAPDTPIYLYHSHSVRYGGFGGPILGGNRWSIIDIKIVKKGWTRLPVPIGGRLTIVVGSMQVYDEATGRHTTKTARKPRRRN